MSIILRTADSGVQLKTVSGWPPHLFWTVTVQTVIFFPPSGANICGMFAAGYFTWWTVHILQAEPFECSIDEVFFQVSKGAN